MRRLTSSLLLLAFAASLHASVPSVAPSDKFNQNSTTMQLDQGRSKQPLPLTAAPADNLSFYIEFYSTEQLPVKTERKDGFLHWFTSMVKKTASKVNFLD